MPKGSAIRPPKHGEIRHRAPERAAMKATRRVLDARDSTPTIRTNLPYLRGPGLGAEFLSASCDYVHILIERPSASDSR